MNEADRRARRGMNKYVTVVKAPVQNGPNARCRGCLHNAALLMEPAVNASRFLVQVAVCSVQVRLQGCGPCIDNCAVTITIQSIACAL